MAKSIRSKRKRKMRNVKRQKNAPKELALLKKVLSSGIEPDVEMKDLVTGEWDETTWFISQHLDTRRCFFSLVQWM